MTSPAFAPPIRAVIIGCGVIGLHHASVLAQHPAFEVTALVDVSEPALAAAAQSIADQGAPRPHEFTDLAAACASGVADLAVITTPSGMHVDQAEAALAANLHVVIEKPLDVDLGRALLIADAADAAPHLSVSVISQHRFDPASVAARAALDAGRLGALTSAIASVPWYRSDAYYASGAWRGTWRMDGGGAVMNQGIHTVDLLRWFLGRPVQVSARVARLAHAGIEVEDVAVATVEFESGALAVVHCTTAAYPSQAARLALYGTHGSAVIEADELAFLHAAPADLDPGAQPLTGASAENHAAEWLEKVGRAGDPPPGSPALAGHWRQYDDIARSVMRGERPGVTARDAAESLALVRAIYVSAATRQTVDFGAVLGGEYEGVRPDLNG